MHKNILPICILSLLTDNVCYMLVLPILTPLLFDENSILLSANLSVHIRPLFISCVLSAYSISLLFSAPIIGLLSDIFGRKKIICFCLTLEIIAYSFYIFSIYHHNIITFILGRFVEGFAKGSGATIEATITDISKNGKQLTKNFGLTAATNSIGKVISPLINSFLIYVALFDTKNFTTPFWIGLFCYLLNMFFFIFFFKDVQCKKHSFIHLKDICNTIKVSNNKSILAIWLLFSTGWAMFTRFLPIILKNKFHASNIMINQTYVFLGICLIISQIYLLRIITNAIPFRIVITCSFCIVFTCFFSLALIQQPIFLVIIIPLLAISYTPIRPNINSTMAQYNQNKGKILGMLSSTRSIGYIIASFIATYASQIHPNTICLVSGCLIAISTIFTVYSKSIGLLRTHNAQSH